MTRKVALFVPIALVLAAHAASAAWVSYPRPACPDTMTVVGLKSALNTAGACSPQSPATPGAPGDTLRGVGGIVIGFDEIAPGYDVYVQMSGGGPTGMNSGIDVSSGGSNLRAVYGLNLGDSVVVEYARVAVDSGVAQLVAPNGSFSTPDLVLRKVSSGNPLPTPVSIGTFDLSEAYHSNPTAAGLVGSLLTLAGPVVVARTLGLAPHGMLVIDPGSPQDSVFIDLGKLTNLATPSVGTYLLSISGILNDAARGWRIMPRSPGDIEGSLPPALADGYSVTDHTYRIVFDHDVTVASATNVGNYALGSFGTVNSATMDSSYAVFLDVTNGLPHGAPETVTVNGVVGRAGGIPMTAPASVTFLAGVMSAAEVQAPNPDSLLGTPCVDKSNYAGPAGQPGPRMSLTGTVTAAFGNLYYVQDEGGGVRGGVAISAPVHPLVVGHRYLVSGAVQEFSRETQVTQVGYVVDNGAGIVPPPASLAISVATDTTCDAHQALLTGEDYEGMLVSIAAVGVVSVGGPGASFRVAGPLGLMPDTLDVVDLANTLTLVPQVGQDYTVTGILSQSGGGYRLLPRHLTDLAFMPYPSDSAAPCSTTAWTVKTTAGPVPRQLSASVLRDFTGSVVLFGGSPAAGAYLGDTWEWDGAFWLLRGPANSPSPRAAHAMAYDPRRDRVVLFGGSGATGTLGDTWEWDGTDWTRVSTAGPGARTGAMMSWDAVLQKVVLYGGTNGITYQDTWAWDGIAWTQVAATGPPARCFGGMATDPQRQRVVLFGGQPTAAAGGVMNDTWEWDGTAWTNIATTRQPAGRSRMGMTYCPDCARILVCGGAGLANADSTWRWDGYTWQVWPVAPGSLVAPTLSFDLANSKLLLFGGADPLTRAASGATWELCGGCDDLAAPTDSMGNVVFPSTLDTTAAVTYTAVDTLLGNVSTLYPGYHTSADTWYDNFPCETSIGGTVPPEASNPDLADSLLAAGINASPQEIADSLASWDQRIGLLHQNDPDTLATAPPVGPSPDYVDPAVPYCPPAGMTYVFGGRDIVFIHGLKTEHVYDRDFASPAGSLVDWKHPTTFPGNTDNPEFYNTGGYYRDIAVANWEPHIQKFLRDHHIANRYVIVAYPCNARLAVGVLAILTQISDAMRFGTNVVDLTGRGYTKNFGTPSFVIISHSTGGLATDASLWSAQNYPSLHAQFIARRCKAHIALTGAFGGSHYASAGVALSMAISSPWLCPLMNWFVSNVEQGDAITGILHTVACAEQTALNSVLVDLSPTVTKYRWGQAEDNTGVPTILISGAHPSFLAPMKNILLPGFDDGVLTLNSQDANPNIPLLWPSGFFVKYGPVGMPRLYDMGMWKYDGGFLRANDFYIDQVIEAKHNLATAILPFYVAGAATPYVSPVGMLEPFGRNMLGLTDGYNVLRRRGAHYSFIQSTSDHFTWRNPKWGNNYKPSFGETNNEETRVIQEQDEPALYARYTPGPTYYAGDDQPLLTSDCLPAEEARLKGQYVEWSRRIFGHRFHVKWWVWRRQYHTLVGMQDNMACDYMYGSILKCAPPATDCNSNTGIGGRQKFVFAASSRPNPFSSALAIDFETPRPGPVELAVMDLAGRRVKVIVNGPIEAGMHSAVWDGTDESGRRVAPGMYLWRVRVGSSEIKHKTFMVR